MFRLVAVPVSLLLALITLTANPASAKEKPGCASEGTLVVDVTQRIKNVDDVASDGRVWALDTVDERMRIWRTGHNRYCVRLDYSGTFTSFAGASPAGTGTISAGVTGSIENGTQFLRATGTFAPTVPTSGFIGEVDADCQQDGSCASTAYRFTERYFSRVNSLHFGWFSATYDGGTHGVWHQSTDGDSGDITD